MGNIALAYIKATVVLAHSQGRLRSLAGRTCMGRNPSKQSKYYNRTVTEMVYKRSAFVKEYLWWLSTGLHAQVAISCMHLRLETIKL